MGDDHNRDLRVHPPTGITADVAAVISLTIVPLLFPEGRETAARCLSGLPGQQQLRALALQDERQRTEYILCHRALQCLAAAEGPAGSYGLVYTPSGKPQLRPGPHVCLSRTRGFAAIALCLEHEIGVDIAHSAAEVDVSGALRHPGLKGRVRMTGSDDKRAFLTGWTELEAICKLRQIPMQTLLAAQVASPACLVTYHEGELVVSVACEADCKVDLAWAKWQDDSVQPWHS